MTGMVIVLAQGCDAKALRDVSQFIETYGLETVLMHEAADTTGTPGDRATILVGPAGAASPVTAIGQACVIGLTGDARGPANGCSVDAVVLDAGQRWHMDLIHRLLAAGLPLDLNRFNYCFHTAPKRSRR